MTTNQLNPFPDRVDPHLVEQLAEHLGVPMDVLYRLEVAIDGTHAHLLVKTTVGADFKGKRRIEWPRCANCNHPRFEHGANGHDVCLATVGVPGPGEAVPADCQCDHWVPPWATDETEVAS